MKSKKFNLILIIITGLIFLSFAMPFMSWLLFAGIIALALKPLQKKFLQKKLKVGQTFSVYIILFSLMLFLVPFLLSFVSFFSESRGYIIEIREQSSFQSVNSMVSLAYDKISFLPSFLEEAQAKVLVRRGLKKIAEPSFEIIKDFFISLPQVFIGLFFFAAGLFYFISDSQKINQFCKKLPFVPQENFDKLILSIQNACQATLFAAIVTGLAQALIISITGYFLGADYFFTLFFITFFLSQIPIVGTAPVTLSLMIFFSSRGMVPAVIVVLVAGVLAGFSDNIVRAWMLQRYDSLHPFAGLIAAIGGIFILGPIGVFLGPVVAMIFFKLVEFNEDY